MKAFGMKRVESVFCQLDKNEFWKIRECIWANLFYIVEAELEVGQNWKFVKRVWLDREHLGKERKLAGLISTFVFNLEISPELPSLSTRLSVGWF